MTRQKNAKLENIIRRIRRERMDVASPEEEIAAGRVRVGGRVIMNPRTLVRACEPLAIGGGETVLRRTLKLRAALAALRVPVAGRVALDLGASTGGFTRALLEAGAARVYAVDAGHGQLLGSLRIDPRVVNLERTNLGALGAFPDRVEMITMDLSYLAIARAASEITRLSYAPGADLIALVKPMFELGLAHAPTVDTALERAVRAACTGLAANGWTLIDSMRSPILGGRGAVEGFVHARRAE